MIYLKKLCDNFLPHIDRNKDTLAYFNENCPGIQRSLDCVRTKTLESWLTPTSPVLTAEGPPRCCCAAPPRLLLPAPAIHQTVLPSAQAGTLGLRDWKIRSWSRRRCGPVENGANLPSRQAPRGALRLLSSFRPSLPHSKAASSPTRRACTVRAFAFVAETFSGLREESRWFAATNRLGSKWEDRAVPARSSVRARV